MSLIRYLFIAIAMASLLGCNDANRFTDKEVNNVLQILSEIDAVRDEYGVKADNERRENDNQTIVLYTYFKKIDKGVVDIINLHLQNHDIPKELAIHFEQWSDALSSSLNIYDELLTSGKEPVELSEHQKTILVDNEIQRTLAERFIRNSLGG